MDLSACIETANMLADTAAAVIRDGWLGQERASSKPDGTPLTRTDLKVEDRMREVLAARHPDHSVLGEEYGLDRRAGAFTWVLDPIDGTRQFAAGLLNFGVLVALCVDDVPVLGLIDQPLANMRCIGVKGLGTRLNGRRIHAGGVQRDLQEAVIALANPLSFDPDTRPVYDDLSRRGSMIVHDGGCIAYMALADGRIDICLNGFDLDPFDICALVPIVEEAGGRITTWDGTVPTLNHSGGIVATAGETLHEEVMRLIDSGWKRPI